MTNQAVGSVRREGETYTLVIEREYPAPPVDVWNALTDPEMLEKWLGTVAIDGRVGGSFQISFDGEERAGGTILRFEPPAALEFEWGEPGVPSTVLFELRETASGTSVRLTHARQAQDMARNTGPGWHAHFDLFEAVLTGQEAKWEEVYAAAKPRYGLPAEGA